MASNIVTPTTSRAGKNPGGTSERNDFLLDPRAISGQFSNFTVN